KKQLNNIEKAHQIISKVFKFSQNRIDRINQHVTIFIQNLRDRSYSRKPINLSIYDYQVINDYSYFALKNQNNKLDQLFDKFVYFFKLFKVKIILPTDLFLIFWNIFQFIISYLFFIYCSLMFFFGQNTQDQIHFRVIFWIILVVFILDLCISFNTAFFHKDLVIHQRKQIAKKYLESYFLFDFMSIFAIFFKLFVYNQLSYNPDHDFIIYLYNFLVFSRVFTIQNKRKQIQELITLKDNQKHILKLFDLLGFIIITAHFVCIEWNLLAVYQEINGFEIYWVQKAHIQDSPWTTRYVQSFYWSVTTMSTVGYGDITPTNTYEQIFASLNMIMFSCVFAYSVNNIGMILQEIEKNSKELNNNLSTIQKFLNRKQVNFQLKSRVIHYLNFLAEEQKDRDKQAEDLVFNKLSNKLRDEIITEINTKILVNFQIFTKNFSISTLNKLVFRMKEVIILPNEIIFKEEEIDDQSIYFIEDGIIEIFHQNLRSQGDLNVIKKLGKNSLFGEISFFSGLQRKASARSVNLSTLYKIKRQDFLEIIIKNSEDYEKYKMIQEQIIFLKDFSQINLVCYSCGAEGHLGQECRKTHQYFDKQFIILKKNFSIFQKRFTQIQRRKKIEITSL
ncbi:hypothetical protein IMG5_085560, partial [Ichthyophthirius multifiliis]